MPIKMTPPGRLDGFALDDERWTGQDSPGVFVDTSWLGRAAAGASVPELAHTPFANGDGNAASAIAANSSFVMGQPFTTHSVSDVGQVTLASAAAASMIVGTVDNDVLTGGNDADFIKGGSGPDENYVTGLTDLMNGGVHAVGYVWTLYGQRDLAEVKADIDLYFDYYRNSAGNSFIEGIFFDEVSSSAADISYYQDLYTYVTNLGLSAILNPGTNPDSIYFSSLSQANIVVFEDTQAAWDNSPKNFAYPQRSSALIHTAGDQTSMIDSIDAAVGKVSSIYVTPDVMDDPWDTLPSYWTAEVSYAQQNQMDILLPLYSYPSPGSTYIWDDVAAAGSVVTAIINPHNGPQTGNDTIQGGGGNDILYGYDGEDMLDGGADDDELYGGAERDTLSGGSGNDTLDGGSGNDSVDGGVGNDALYGGIGSDTMRGGDGNDHLYSGAGGDAHYGDAGFDYVHYDNAKAGVTIDMTAPFTGTGNAAGDTFDGIEAIIGSIYNDVMYGNAGDNNLQGRAGNDTIDGRDGIDTLYGDVGTDTLRGGVGDDHLFGGTGADALYGDAGSDYVRYDFAAAAVVVDISGATPGTGEAAGDTFFVIENVIGSAFNDTLYGDNATNALSGGAGADTLYGRGGADWMYGGADNDHLYGGAGADAFFGDAGFDYVMYDTAAAPITVDMAGTVTGAGDAAGDTFNSIEALIGSVFADQMNGDELDNNLQGRGGNDTIEGRGGVDALYGDAGNDTIRGGAGNDQLFGGLGADDLYGDAGIDYARYDFAAAAVSADLEGLITNTGEAAGDRYFSMEDPFGSGFADQLFGDGNANALFGRNGDDVIDGRDGADTLYGEAGVDTLYGKAGNDTMFGGDGNDQLFGGLGADNLYGDAGIDYARYDFAGAAVIADLGAVITNTGEAAGDRYYSMEYLFGSAFSDQLFGDSNANALFGRNGDDVINGREGADTIYGEAGADTLTGGSGNDVFVFNAGQANGDTIVDFAGNGALAGDHLLLSGYGTAAQGANVTVVNANTWRIDSANGLIHDTLHITNGAALSSTDYSFI